MHIAAFIEIYLYAGLQGIRDVGTRRERRYYPPVAVIRYYQPHIDACQCRVAQGAQYGLGRNQVRRLDIYIFLRLGDNPHHALHGDVPAVHRARGGNLHRDVAVGKHLREIAGVIKQFLSGEIPVCQEGDLHFSDSGADHPEMGISPVAPLYARGISLGYVHPSGVADTAVDDDYLPVIAVIGVTGEERQPYLQEWLHLHASRLHIIIEFPAEEIGCVVILYPDLNAGLRLRYEYVRNPASERVVLELEEFEMNVVFGGFQVPDQSVEHFLTVRIYLEGIAFEREGLACHPQQFCQIGVIALDSRIYKLSIIVHYPGLEQIAVLVLHQPFVFAAGTEDKPEYESQHRKQADDQHPAQSLQRMPVFGNHYAADTENEKQKQNLEYGSHSSFPVLYFLKQLGGGILRVHLLYDTLKHAFLGEDVGSAQGTHTDFPVEFLLAPGTERLEQ